MTNKTLVAKPSKPKKESEAPKWLFENIAEASKNARKIYFLYIGFLLYCALTVISTSDRQIILNDAVSLPILKLNVSLNYFFILTPVMAIFVFIYFQLYLNIRKDLINNLKTYHSQIGREHFYPWMLVVLDYPKKGFIGRLQSAVIKFSVWGFVPLILIIISTWYVKKHNPVLTYFIGLTPIFCTIIVFWFWFQYENVKFKIRRILKIILNNPGKDVLFFIVIIYEIILLFFLIPNANNGFPHVGRGERDKKRVLYHLRSFFCVDLSYQKLITEPKIDYEGIFWLNRRGIHLEGALLDSSVLKRADLREAHFQEASLIKANLQDANLFGAELFGANLRGANLRGVTLFYADLQEANLQEADLQEADLQEADLKEAYLVGANLWKAFLWGADLQEANLRGAFLGKANFSYADLSDAILDGADFRDADLRNVQNLIIKQLSEVKTLYKAKLDPELEKQIKEKYPYLFEKPKVEE